MRITADRQRKSWPMIGFSPPKRETSMIPGSSLGRQLNHQAGPTSPNVLDVLGPPGLLLQPQSLVWDARCPRADFAPRCLS